MNNQSEGAAATAGTRSRSPIPLAAPAGPRSWRWLSLALLPVIASGCISPIRPLSTTFTPAAPVCPKPKADVLYVFEPEEARPLSGNSSIAPALLTFIPLVPYGPQKLSPETFLNYPFRKDMTTALVKDLAASGIARSVERLDYIPPDGHTRKNAYYLHSKMKEGIWHRNCTTYGLSVYGVYLWLVGAPVSFGDVEISLEFELRDLGHQSLGRTTFTAKRKLTEWIYSAGMGSYFYDTLPRVYGDISPLLREFVAKNVKEEQAIPFAGGSSILASAPTRKLTADEIARVTGAGTGAAVLNFDDKGGLSRDEVALLTDRFTIELDKLGAYKLVNRTKMNEILTEQKFSRKDNCSASECAVEAGQMLGTEYMVYGSIGKIGTLFTVNSYIIDVKTGGTIATASSDISGGIENMLTAGLAHNVYQLLQAAMKK